MRKVKSAAGEEEMYNYLMSPRYFAKFSQHPRAEDQWYHFTPKGYIDNSPEFKLHVLKLRLFMLIKRFFRIK